MYINLELYRVFCVVASSGSITKAAAELFISQPAVSQSIKQLEQQIGGRLFMRTSKGMELTYEGKIIYEYVSRATALIAIAEKKFTQLKKLNFGEINIGAGDAFCRYYLIDFIKQFKKKFPEINIRITNRTSEETLLLLRQGKVDLGFVNMPLQTDYVEIEDFLEVSDCFCCSEQYYGAIDHPLSAQEIAQLPLIMLEKLSASRKQTNDFFQSMGVELIPALELGNIDLIADMARKGIGVGYCLKKMVEKDVIEGRLFEIPLAFTLPTRKIGLATLKGVPLNFAATKFLDEIMLYKKEHVL